MKTNKIKKGMTYSHLWILVILFVAGASCNNPQKEASTETADEVVIEGVQEEFWIIHEHQINEIPLTSKAELIPLKTQETKAQAEQTDEEEQIAVDEEMLEEEYEIVKLAALEEDLMEQEYETLVSTVEVTEVAIPLEETQTVISYAKKDKNDAALQVVTNLQTGEVEQITFIDKNHQDVYDVQAGMTGKEVRKLRRELKHMVKKGQVFLYDDQSNIMYLMDVKNMEGDEITIEHVETMEVQAIVWKDKKHHKKNE